jgi:hypothetical protein
MDRRLRWAIAAVAAGFLGTSLGWVLPGRAWAQQVTESAEVSPEPDVLFNATLRIGELRFDIVPQSTLQVTVQPEGQRIFRLDTTNLPRPLQPGAIYHDVTVRLTVGGTLADLVTGTAGPGSSLTSTAPLGE